MLLTYSFKKQLWKAIDERATGYNKFLIFKASGNSWFALITSRNADKIRINILIGLVFTLFLEPSERYFCWKNNLERYNQIVFFQKKTIFLMMIRKNVYAVRYINNNWWERFLIGNLEIKNISQHFKYSINFIS